MSTLELLSLPFMQRALLAAVFTGLAAPAVGTYIVQRRLALMGDGIGHVAVTGVALGLLTGTSPTWTAVVVAVIGAILIEVIRERGHTNGDVALALLFYGGLAGGVLITGLAGQSAAGLQSYLFGSITTISVGDVVVTMALAAVVVVVCLGLAPQLFAVAQDQEFARVAGLNVRVYNVLVAVLAAVSVTVAMRTVGLLLVSALMVVPVATAQQLGAILIEVIRERGHTNGDVALALLFYGGLAGGVLITGLAGQSAAGLQSYLFGSITTISVGDVVVTMALAAVVVVVCLGLAPQLFAVAQDQEFARVAGLNVRVYNVLVAVLAAVSVTVAMRTVGLLLVSALMVVPVATAQQLTRSFRSTLAAAMLLGLGASVGGLLVSAVASSRADVAPGPTIVLLALAGFVVTWPVGLWLRRRQHLTEPFDDEVPDDHHDVSEGHPHQHGEDCGHVAVPHGDHVDYLHDGHRHAPHGRHYDEH